MKQLLLTMLLCAVASPAIAADKLIVISPHRKSIQDEFVPKFKEYYKATYKTDVDVEWLDQGGTSDDVKFLRAKFEKNPATSGVDIFWGGGTAVYMELAGDKLLAPYSLPKPLDKDVPDSAAGVPLYDASKSWYASAMSSFGIFYNRKLLKMDGIAEPATWDDLANPKYKGQLTLADPRRSGTANTMNTIILQAMGWDKGFELLTKIAGNTRLFTHSSSDPIKAVVSGDASASMAIDFYAVSKIADLGKENLGFTMPPGQTILDPDPIAILKGAPNRTVAERFVNYVLSPDAQKLLILPKGTEGGPRIEALGRMAINTKAYDQTEGKRANEFNPFKQKAFMKLDLEKSAKMQRVFNDLIGAIQIDTHHDLKDAWSAIVKRGMKPEEVAEFAKPPVSEAELLALADKWGDDVFRNKTINTWVESSRAKYKKLAGK
jgi:ABC-type Fe3+ transport system substrate-binding protein